jgi:hypothetical protein
VVILSVDRGLNYRERERLTSADSLVCGCANGMIPYMVDLLPDAGTYGVMIANVEMRKGLVGV